MIFPYTSDVLKTFPYTVKCPSESETDQWIKYRWLVNEQKIKWGDDFIALETPILATTRKPLYEYWAFKNEQHALLFSLKWS